MFTDLKDFLGGAGSGAILVGALAKLIHAIQRNRTASRAENDRWELLRFKELIDTLQEENAQLRAERATIRQEMLDALRRCEDALERRRQMMHKQIQLLTAYQLRYGEIKEGD